MQTQHCALFRCIRQDDQEFLSAQASHKIAIPELVGKMPCEMDKHLISDQVSIRIVDPLEMIDVQDGETDRQVRKPMFSQDYLRVLQAIFAAGDTCESIDLRFLHGQPAT